MKRWRDSIEHMRIIIKYYKRLKSVRCQLFISAIKSSCIKILRTELAATWKFRDEFSTPTARSGEHLTDTVSHVDPRVAKELQVVGSQEEDHIQPHDSVSQVELRSNGKQRPRASQSRSGSGTASVSRASQRSVRSISVADERIRLAAEKAAMIVEASLLSEQDSLAQERLRLEQQERLLKLKTKIAKTEAKEKIYEDFEVIDDEYSSRIRPSSGQSGAKVIHDYFPYSTTNNFKLLLRWS